jgi:hypothetical protein
MTLGNVLDPIGILLVRGRRERFTSLMSWEALNTELSRLRVGDERVRLVKRGVPLPRGEFVYAAKSGGAEYLNGPAVTSHVLDGATLVVNMIDELSVPIRRLAESAEQLLKVYITANLYAGWRSDNGFDVHWDRHDTLILQLIGRKNWKVWGPTRDHPMSGDDPRRVPSPTADPVWEGALEDGDLLYMPRGWWHVACPREEPSVHVTLAIKGPTGLDLLEWMASELRETRAARLDLPHWNRASEQAALVADLRAACMAFLDDDVIARFMRRRDQEAHSRPIIALPRGPEPKVPDLTDDLPIRLVRGRQLHLRRDGELVGFEAQGTTWKCHASLAPVLGLLSHVTPWTVGELAEQLGGDGRAFLRPLLSALLLANVIWGERHAAAAHAMRESSESTSR